MNEEAQEWAREQLKNSDVPSRVRSAVLQLLANWYNNYLTDDKDKKIAVEAFYALALNQALAVEGNVVHWEPVKPGNIWRSDRVRVKSDAYLGQGGRDHNGRLGTVVAIRGGDIIVKYTDGKQPSFEAVHHKPQMLERAQ